MQLFTVTKNSVWCLSLRDGDRWWLTVWSLCLSPRYRHAM